MNAKDSADRLRLGGVSAVRAHAAQDEMMAVEPRTRQAERARRPTPTVHDPRPTIRISSRLHDVVNQAVEALTADPGLYQRANSLVRIVRTAEPESFASGRGEIPAGTPQIRALSNATLRERLTSIARFVKFDARVGSLVEKVPDVAIVTALADRGEWNGIRPLVMHSDTPIGRPDLSFVTEPGYDAITGCVYEPSCLLPPIPTAPTLDDARAALKCLSEPFADFPYVAESHRSVAVAATLTVLARSSIPGAVPGFLFDATTPGSGKSLQADCISLIATGRPASRMSWPGNDIELEKVLGAYALRGATLFLLDNVTTPFGGGPLDRVLTAQDTVDLRVLGRSDVPTLRWRAVVLATGNNIDVRGDTTRRVLIARLEPNQEKPEERADFRHEDLLGWLRGVRPQIVAAALTLLRAWALAGKPRGSCKPWGSFEAWARIVPPALVWAGAADPMGARIGSAQGGDAEREVLACFLAGLERYAPNGITARALIEGLYAHDFGRKSQDDYDSLREAIEAMVEASPGSAPTAERLGRALRSRKGRIVGGRQLITVSPTGGVMRWKAVQV